MKPLVLLGLFVVVFCSGLFLGTKIPRADENQTVLSAAIDEEASGQLKSQVAKLQNKNLMLSELLKLKSAFQEGVASGELGDSKSRIDAFQDHQIRSFLQTTYGESLLEEIHDVKEFSGNALELFEEDAYDRDIDTPLHADISVSLSRKPESATGQSFVTVSGKQAIYAHINLHGNIGLGDNQYFIRWSNADTRDVLLFDPKSMNPNSSHNWVSYSPSGSWESGNYRVSIFRFDDQLTPLSTKQFYIDAQPSS